LGETGNAGNRRPPQTTKSIFSQLTRTGYYEKRTIGKQEIILGN
jgi:hypothetical protein